MLGIPVWIMCDVWADVRALHMRRDEEGVALADYDHVSEPQTLMAERAVPQNIDAERAVLAAMILSPDILEELFSTNFTADDFYRPAHAKIFTAISELYAENTPVDQVSVADRLRTKGQLEEVGGSTYIIELANNSFALANWRNHAKIVRRTATLRDLIKAGTRITALGYDAPDDVQAVVESAEHLLFDVTDKQVSRGFTKIDDLMIESFNTISELAQQQTKIVGVPTGFTDLDKRLAGLRGGSLTVLAARPGVGKTSFALNIAVNAAKRGNSVAIFSLEMSSNEIVPRILSAESRVELQRMRNGSLESSDWAPITAACDALSQLDLWIDDTPSLSILEMKAKARRQLHNCQGKGLIILDYLQLMQPQGKQSESRQVEIAEISRGLKVLAKELDVPIIALSQLSRAVELRQGHRPVLSDLRESGAIEQDADIVLFLDRAKMSEEPDEENPRSRGETKLIIAKNRNGATGDIPLMFFEECTRFVSVERTEPYNG
jgi:replicative DNA helicase